MTTYRMVRARRGGPRPGMSGPLLDAVERWNRVALGVVAFAIRESENHLSGQDDHATVPIPEQGGGARTDPPAAGPPSAEPPERSVWHVLPGALLALALHGEARLFDLVADLEVRLGAVVGILSRRGPGGWVSRNAFRMLEPWDARWREEQAEHVDAAVAFLASVGPSSLDELLGRIDVERIVDRVPIEYVMDHVDVNAIVAGVVHELRYTDLLREGTGAFLRESTGVLAATTADVVRGQVSAVSRITGIPFLRVPTGAEVPPAGTVVPVRPGLPAIGQPEESGPGPSVSQFFVEEEVVQALAERAAAQLAAARRVRRTGAAAPVVRPRTTSGDSAPVAGPRETSGDATPGSV